MTRDETINKMVDMANKLHKDGWSRDGEMAIWNLCSDWNSEHIDGCYDEAEIFMCDYQSENSDHVDGFMIEDDYWIFEDR